MRHKSQKIDEHNIIHLQSQLHWLNNDIFLAICDLERSKKKIIGMNKMLENIKNSKHVWDNLKFVNGAMEVDESTSRRIKSK